MEKQAGHHEVFFQFPLYLAAEARLKIKDHNLKDPKTNREKNRTNLNLIQLFLVSEQKVISLILYAD